MAEKNNAMNHIPKEKFTFVHEGERISDKKFDDKPISYLKDAWIRFRKSKASVVAAIIIISIILYSFLLPLFVTSHDASFLCGTYAKKPARVTWLRDLGIATGGVKSTVREDGYIQLLAIAVGAESQGEEILSFAEITDAYNPILKTGESYTQEMPNKKLIAYYPTTVDTYLQVGFKYIDVEQTEYQNILDYQERTGLQVVYPLVDTKNGYCFMPDDANFWYKTNAKGTPVSTTGGRDKQLTYAEDLVLEENYKRNADGSLA